MLQNSYIYNPYGPDTTRGQPRSKAWSSWLRAPRLVMPRSLCTYHRIPCEGIPFFKLQDFARLQAQQHSPFINFGSSAVKHGQYLHLWIWDQKHEERFVQKNGQLTRFNTLVQSLLTRPIGKGVVWQTSTALPGCEAQLWQNRTLQDSLWFDAPPSAQDWQQRFAQYPELAANGWPSQLPPPRMSTDRAWPFAINLTPRIHKTKAIPWGSVAKTVLVIAAAGIAAWAAWLQGQIIGYQEKIADNRAVQEQKINQDQPQQMARARTYQVLQRIKAIKSLNAQSQTGASLEEITKMFSRQGLWVRDIDITGQTIDATLIAPAGVTPRLTAILGIIESSPLFDDARFTDVVPGGGFRFSWRITPQAVSPEKSQP